MRRGDVFEVDAAKGRLHARDGVDQFVGVEFRPMFPRVTVEVIQRAGHWVQADQPHEFIAGVRRALNGNSQTVLADRVH